MKALKLDVKDHIAWVTFNRPEVANAIDHEMMSGLNDIVQKAESLRNDIRCLVFTGAGAHFCSGVDLRATGMAPAATPPSHSMERRFLDYTLDRIAGLGKPIVAAVNGPATGAGMTLALTADLVVMAENAFL